MYAKKQLKNIHKEANEFKITEISLKRLYEDIQTLKISIILKCHYEFVKTYKENNANHKINANKILKQKTNQMIDKIKKNNTFLLCLYFDNQKNMYKDRNVLKLIISY